jgi:hypothetical protein
MNKLMSKKSLIICFCFSIIVRFVVNILLYAIIIPLSMSGNNGVFDYSIILDELEDIFLLIMILAILFYESMFWLSTNSIPFNQSIATMILFISHCMPYVITGLITCIMPSLIEFAIVTNVILLNIIEIIAFIWILSHNNTQRVQ